MTQIGSDGAFDPTPQADGLVELMGELLALAATGGSPLDYAGADPFADAVLGLPPAPRDDLLGVHRVPRLTIDDLGPELRDEVLTAVRRLRGDELPAPVDLSEIGEAQAALQVNPDGTTERFGFPVDDLDGLGDAIKARLNGERVVGAKAIQLASNLTMWTGGYDGEPTEDFLVEQAANLAATVITWMVHDGVLPIFGPVLFTAGGPNDAGSFDGLDEQGVAVLEEILGVVPAGDAPERFGPKLRELALRGSYLQAA